MNQNNSILWSMNDMSLVLKLRLHKTTTDIYTSYYFSHYFYNIEQY